MFSLTFDGIEKQMSYLIPNMELMLLMRKSITKDIVLKKNLSRFELSVFLPDFFYRKFNKKHKNSFLIKTIDEEFKK